MGPLLGSRGPVEARGPVEMGPVEARGPLEAVPVERGVVERGPVERAPVERGLGEAWATVEVRHDVHGSRIGR